MSKSSTMSKTNVKKTRYDVITNAIFGKYITSTEKLISDFSPNNIRALIFSDKSFMVIYHKRKVPYEIFNYSTAFANDCKAIAEEQGTNIKSIFSVISDVRKMSHIEEIVFLSDYNSLLLTNDMKKCKGGLEQISKDYPRLRGIYVVNKKEITIESIKKALDHKGEAKVLSYFTGITDLLHKYAKEDMRNILPKNSAIKYWFMETNLVGQTYAMDKENGELGKYFADIKKQGMDYIKKKAERAKVAKELQGLVKSKHSIVLSQAERFTKLYTAICDLYGKKGARARTTFAYIIEPEFVVSMLLRYLENKETTTMSNYKEIDWTLLKQIYTNLDLGNEYEYIRNILKEFIDKKQLSNRESMETDAVENKVKSAKTALVVISEILVAGIKIMSLMVYFAMLKYVVQPGSEEYAGELMKKMNGAFRVQDIPYNIAMVRILNEIVPDDSKMGIEFFPKIFKKVEKDETFKSKFFAETAMNILRGLEAEDVM